MPKKNIKFTCVELLMILWYTSKQLSLSQLLVPGEIDYGKTADLEQYSLQRTQHQHGKYSPLESKQA
jgi:hypothetical protein